MRVVCPAERDPITRRRPQRGVIAPSSEPEATTRLPVPSAAATTSELPSIMPLEPRQASTGHSNAIAGPPPAGVWALHRRWAAPRPRMAKVALASSGSICRRVTTWVIIARRPEPVRHGKQRLAHAVEPVDADRSRPRVVDPRGDASRVRRPRDKPAGARERCDNVALRIGHMRRFRGKGRHRGPIDTRDAARRATTSIPPEDGAARARTSRTGRPSAIRRGFLPSQSAT